jgi:hypothetical protein
MKEIGPTDLLEIQVVPGPSIILKISTQGGRSVSYATVFVGDSLVY